MKKASNRRKKSNIDPEDNADALSPKPQKAKKAESSNEDEQLKHKHHPATGFDSVFYSRGKRERGSGMQGGQGYSSRGGFGRRG
jgi:hypothetical protein